ncbi:hypothetical protein [Streptomyces europaeiscabiei]|uniref:hypothetical protein n=1 Tax=Streptomyces europaeiscabiei TaxID=146819 RepID=UPI0029B4C817|nr:hypothetical protein [Streptomyces europaeiscabiei]MDX3580950.1 hypothetical protein [Streptomyces europaeiscabiei]MDX3631061.1 hypothetical protein [Streptomyces europaeiscabiei]MDX3648925.1 hypothetical protein [Streptomyces europaeiscabiei]
MDDKSAGRRGGWRLRAVASGAAAAVLLGGCSVGASKRAAEPGAKASGSPTPSASATGQVSAEGGKPSATPSVTPFEADPDRVPRSRQQGAALAEAVAMRPQDWGAGFRAQPLARSAEGTAAVLDEECRWQRRALPDGVLASLSLYSELPGTGKRGTVRVTATVTVHTTVLGADDHLSETLEEALRCPEQQVRADERIAKLMSVGTPRGIRDNNYADDSILEDGVYLTAGGEAMYRWMVTRLGQVTVAVSLKGAEGYTVKELEPYVTRGTVTMLDRVAYELGGGEG